MKRQIRLSIVIVAYNNLNDISNCIDSIKKYNDIGSQLEIIIVDHSSKYILEDISKKYPDIVMMHHNNNGFGGGNNYGVGVSHGEILLFLNPDTLLVEPIFKKILNIFDNNKDIAIVGTQLISPKGKKEFSFYIIDKSTYWHNLLLKVCKTLSIFVDGKMCISGANIFIRKEIFTMAGMFDENIFMYFEEPDLTKRVRDLGYKSFFCPDLHIIHLEGMRTTDILEVYKREYTTAKYYCNKYRLSYLKLLQQNRRYNLFKYIVFKILGMEEALSYRKLIELHSSLIAEEKNNLQKDKQK